MSDDHTPFQHIEAIVEVGDDQFHCARWLARNLNFLMDFVRTQETVDKLRPILEYIHRMLANDLVNAFIQHLLCHGIGIQHPIMSIHKPNTPKAISVAVIVKEIGVRSI